MRADRTQKRRQGRQGSAFILRILTCLVFLTLISVYALSGMFARFSTAGESSDMARVAKWDPSVEAASGTVDTVAITAGGVYSTGQLKFTVHGAKEVKSEYSIFVSLERNGETVSWPTGAAVQLKDKDNKLVETSTSGAFERLGTLEPGASEDFSVSIQASEAVKGSNAEDPYKMNISVRLEQLD